MYICMYIYTYACTYFIRLRIFIYLNTPSPIPGLRTDACQAPKGRDRGQEGSTYTYVYRYIYTYLCVHPPPTPGRVNPNGLTQRLG